MNCANHPERERIAFCQNCGKPLCQECARVVGTAVFCEPCLEARLAGNQPPPAPGAGYTSGNVGGVNFTATPTGGSYNYTDPASGYTVNGTIPPPHAAGAPNPGLAALLGFIPGVGAMYNGQYAKGIIHLIVFAVLVSLADEHGIFGLFCAGWVFYQVFEAYQTARARRDDTPLPNPFGLNDLGDRLGFGRSWPSGAPAGGGAPASSAYPAPDATQPASSATSATYPPPASGYAPPASGWGAPVENFTGSPYNAPYTPYGVTPPAVDPNAVYPRNRFPMGAIWLIGLGALFLIGNTGLFHYFPVHRLFPLFLIGLGGWLFYYKMTATGATLADDGTPLYRYRLFSALRGSVWVILVGIMFFLANFNILSWGRSWPLFIIVAGVMILAEKTFYNPAAAPPAYPVPPAYPSAPPASASVVPPSTGEASNNQSNQEGR
jgi:hypothetical protein